MEITRHLYVCVRLIDGQKGRRVNGCIQIIKCRVECLLVLCNSTGITSTRRLVEARKSTGVCECSALVEAAHSTRIRECRTLAIESAQATDAAESSALVKAAETSVGKILD